MRRAWERAIGRGLAGAAMAWLAIDLARAPRWTVDDAFIVARYAANLVRHGVFAFNVDGPRVEGITSPLFGLIAVVAVALGRSPTTAMTGAGVVACVLGVGIVYRLAARMGVSPWLSGVAAWIYATLPEHLTHAMAGLETEAFIACELACALAFLHAFDGKRRAEVALLACSLAACLLRPEGFAVTAALVGLAGLRALRRGDLVVFARRTALGLVLPLGALLGARLAYFHALLPNTFYAKTRGAHSWTIAKDFVSLFDDQFLDFVAVAVAAALIAALLRAGRARTAPKVKALVLAAVVLLGAFLATYGHPDVMNYSRRFAMHALPWMVVVALAIVAEAEGRVARVWRRHGARGPALFFAAAAAGVALVWEPQRELQRAEEISHMERHIAVRRYWYEPAIGVLESSLASGPTPRTAPLLAVYPDAGYIPWRTGWKTVDFGRLNDGYLAREARTPDDVVNYFFAVAPDAVVFSSYGKDRLWNREATKIVQDARFANYEQRGQWLDGRAWGLTVFVRR